MLSYGFASKVTELSLAGVRGTEGGSRIASKRDFRSGILNVNV